MKALAIGVTGLRRMLRDRSNIFFVFVLPLAIILMVGAQFGSGGGPRIVVVHDGGEIGRSITDRLAAAEVDVDVLENAGEVADQVERGGASAGVVIPAGIDRTLTAGGSAEIGFVSRPTSSGSLRPLVNAALSEATADLRVARVVAGTTDRTLDDALELVAPITVPGLSVEVETVGEALFGPRTGQFSVGAAQQLVLFVFLTALAGSAALIQSRQLGVTRRMLSTPTSVSTIVAGEGVGRFLVGVTQGLYIIVFTLVAFGVTWGNPLGWTALLIGLAATGAGGAMLLGALFRNDQQAGGISVMASLGLAALGGCMFPLELFSPTMQRIAHLTPHAWALDGFADLVYRNGSLSDVMGEVVVLLIYGTVLLALASWRLRKVITRV